MPVSRRGSVRQAFILLLAMPSIAPAQAHGTVAGLVHDSAGVPVASAHVSSGARHTLSDSAGRFSLGGVPVGNAVIVVRRLGFEPNETTVTVVVDGRHTLTVTLVALPVDLPAVTARARAIGLADFYRHREAGGGRYFDREQIENSRAQLTSDLLRRLPGTALYTDRSGRQVLRMRRSARPCPPDIWVDGVHTHQLEVDDVPLTDIEALEVYSGPAGLPPEYQNRLGNPACGAIVIWTRLPG